MKVLISSPCSASVIIQYGIKSWPIWECEPSKFQWNYDDKEICLIIQGEAKNKKNIPREAIDSEIDNTESSSIN